MLQRKVLDIYKLMFGIKEGSIKTWWTNGYNSIRIELMNRRQIVFTYTDDTNWRLEPIDTFIKTMNKKLN